MIIYATDIHFHQAGDGRVRFFYFIKRLLCHFVDMVSWYLLIDVKRRTILLVYSFNGCILLILIYIVYVGNERIYNVVMRLSFIAMTIKITVKNTLCSY